MDLLKELEALVASIKADVDDDGKIDPAKIKDYAFQGFHICIDAIGLGTMIADGIKSIVAHFQHNKK